MLSEPYQVKLENIFEGPMDLLVHLIKKNEVDIYDIPIALITAQYLEYLEWMKSMNMDFAGDFIVMAATLTQIKSRMLLPTYGIEADEEDPRMQIAKPLLEYLQMKAAAEKLANRNILGDVTFPRSIGRENAPIDREDEYIKVGLFELIDAFQKILQNVSSDTRVDFTPDRLSVTDRISEIVDVLEARGSVTFEELFSENPEKKHIIITFLALLEMVKLCLIQMVQHVQTGIIRLFYV